MNNNYTLLYRGSRDGYLSTNFHAKCDGKTSTLTIIQTANNYVFGGYTNAAWDSSNTYKSDANAFIFSLINHEHRPMVFKGSSTAIYAHSSYGPTFGAGYDFYISSSSHLNRNSYSNLGTSFSLNGLYASGTAQAQSFLAGSYNFQVAEIEVFQKQ